MAAGMLSKGVGMATKQRKKQDGAGSPGAESGAEAGASSDPGVSRSEPALSRMDLTNTQIDPATAEAFIAERRIGERIKRLRLKKSMGLVELGRHTGLSASFLSQLETGRVVPPLRNLARVAMVFSKDLSYFFETETHTLFRIHRKKERVRLPQTGVDDPTYYFESLGYMVPDRQLDPYFAEFVPLKKNIEVRPHVHPGYEFLYILEGELEIRHADKTHVLTPGDGVYFDASTPHGYRCMGKSAAQAIIVTMHQLQSPQPAMNLRPLGAAMAAKNPALNVPAGRPASTTIPTPARTKESLQVEP